MERPMKKINYQEMYPVYVKEVAKADSNLDNVDAMCQFFIDKVNTHPIAKYIGLFDHYAHTKNLEAGEIAEHIKDAKNIVFCFGAKLPDPKMLAVRPRSIGVCETDTHFVISFMEAPNLALTKIMIDWVEELFNQ